MPRDRRVGLKRIDAALDALRPMGFPDSLVRKTVKKLLKEYGGDDGWTFIEEFSYKLVIEYMLEEQEEENNGPRLLGSNEATLVLENGEAKDNMAEDRLSTRVPSSSRQGQPSKKQAIQADSRRNSCSPVFPCSLKSETSRVELEERFPASKISAEVSSPPTVEAAPLVIAVPCSLKSETTHVKLEKQSSKISEVGSSEMFSPPSVESHPRRRRRPYYGWISSDDEEEPELVHLEPDTSHPLYRAWNRT